MRIGTLLVNFEFSRFFVFELTECTRTTTDSLRCTQQLLQEGPIIMLTELVQRCSMNERLTTGYIDVDSVNASIAAVVVPTPASSPLASKAYMLKPTTMAPAVAAAALTSIIPSIVDSPRPLRQLPWMLNLIRVGETSATAGLGTHLQ